jgi:hypothetical protein
VAVVVFVRRRVCRRLLWPRLNLRSRTFRKNLTMFRFKFSFH